MTVCAWCSRRTENGRAVGVVLKKPHPADTTHGICVDCAEAFEAEFQPTNKEQRQWQQQRT